MSKGFDRFRNLEKRRQSAPTGAGPRPSERFEAVEKPGSAPGSVLPAAAADRFRAPRERPPEIEERAEGEQPFVRCARCEADNTVYAAACINCGSDLGTPEQRAYNERLWAARREESAREAEALAAQQRERAQRAVEEQKARVAMATELARQVGERERRRLDEDGTGWLSGGWGWRGGRPIGLALLERIPDPWIRGAVGALLVAVPGLFVLFGTRGARRAGTVVLLLVIASFLPSRFRRF